MNKLEQVLSRGGTLAAPWLVIRSLARLAARKMRVVIFRYIHRISCGVHVFLGPGIQFVNPQNIHFHDRVSVASNVRLVSESRDGVLEMQQGAQVNRQAELDFSGDLILERNVLISAEAVIYTHDHGRDPRAAPMFSRLVIREGAWVGMRAIVLPSVNYIGKNAVIGAGSVVNVDVPDGATFVGAKGRIIHSDRKAGAR